MRYTTCLNLAFGLMALCLLDGCVSNRSDVTTRSLSTGKQIKVLRVERETRSDKGPTLIFTYVTDIDIQHDRTGLQREVEEIWKDLQTEADQTDVKAVIIEANDETRSGLSTFFVLYRNQNSTWRRGSGFVRESGTTNEEDSVGQ